ncbi:MAG: Ig-like domain-containing protein [Pseudomonadales bacterium]
MQSIAYSNSSDTPPANVQIDWSFSDGNTGEQGSGGALVATGSTTVDITAVNDEPTTPDSSAAGFEDTVLAITLTGADVDGTVVSFEISSLPANGTLYTDAALTDPIVAFNTYAATSEQLVLYFDPDANWNGSTTFTFSAVDNQANWDQSPATATLNINPVNDAALLDLDANDSSASGNDYAVSWTDGSGSVVVADSDASLTDVDSPNIESLTATITNLSDGALEVLSADVTGTSISASYDAATGTLTLSGTDTIANYEQVLRTISYDNTHSTPYSETRILEFSANDGTADSLVATTSIAMNVTQGVLIVSNGGDVVDGDTSSIENLIANQGADGISLREAIIASNNSANGAGGPDIIRFDLSGTGPHTIALASQLPSITDHVIIDASTEPDFAGTPMVVLDGSAAPGGSKAFYLGAGSDGSTIRGLAIHSFATAIEIAGSDNNTVAGNYIGLEADGTTVAGNTDSGIRINGGSSNNTIGGLTQADRNVVAGSAGDGIQLSGAGTTGNQILGNYIGTDATGITAAANAVGIRVQSSATGNSIGGSVAGAGNVISGNSGSGVALGATADNQTIQGNYIGLDATGLAGLGNGQAGLNVLSDSNLIGGDSLTARNVISANSGAGVDIDGDSNRIEGNFIGLDSAGTAIFGNVGAGVHISNGATLNVIGGTAAGVGNVISGNVDGIYIQDATHTTIQANLIGTDVTGLLGLGNTDRGIQLESGADNTIIGGMTVAARNVISANGTDGIIISDGSNPGAGTTGVEIQGNYIGVGIDGATALGNGTNGIRITSVSGNLIGGSAAGAGNIIAHSGEDGIVLGAATATDNTILGNLIHSSTERAIDLGNDGTTLNDAAIALDGDSGANDLQNFAVLYTADIFGSDLRVVGDLDSKADTSYRVEFYSNPLGQEDASGYGEAREYLGFIEVTTDSLGNGSIDTLLSGVGLSAGDRVTATATEIIDAGQIGANDRAAFGSTSEFSQNLPAATGDPAPVIDLDANRSSGAGAPNFSTSFTEDAGAVSVVDADATLFDPDSSALSSLTITITNQLDGTAETLAANTVGTSIVATYDSGTGVLALSGSDTVASYQQVLRSVTYNNSAQDPDTTQRSLTFVASDGANDSNTATTSIAMTAANDPVSGQPVILGTPTEDETLTIDASGISDAEGLGAFSYQWYRDGVAISGATADSYVLNDADVDTNVTVTLSYTDGQGTSESTTSSAVGPIANVNDAPTGSVVIDNLSPGQGDVLTASNTIADADGLSGAISYQWYRDGVAIGSATGNTYATTQTDVNTVITVVASYTDDEGTAESVTSGATAAVSNVNDAVSGQPVILGTPTEDQTLTIDASGISDADGLGSYSYQWYRDGVAISGATTDSHVLSDADVDTNVTVTLSYTDGQGTSESTTSAAVGPIANVNDAPTGAVSIDNLNPSEGDTLTVSNTIADADGISDAISYQWYRDGVAIGSATGATYATVQADVGAAITVVASYTDDQGSAESLTSAATAAVINVNDTVVGQPVILGVATEDETLTIDASGISDEDGLGSFSYQWYRDGVAVSGATADSYLLDDADVGTAITVALAYTDGEGTAESTTSGAVGAVANVNDAPTGSVLIDDSSPSQGDTLTASNSIADADGISGAIGYQWYRDGVAIGSAIGSTYATTQADVGAVITVVASYTDDQGTAESVTSSATAAVTNVNDAVSGQPLIVGTPTEDQTLTIDASGISDADGLGSFSYQWYRDGVAIAGATADSYTLDDADVDAAVSVALAYTDGQGSAETTTSNAVGPIANVNDAPTGAVSIDNLNPGEGDTLSASNTIADADGISGAIGYQWYRDGVAIGSATGTTYETVQADVGAAITVVASYTDDQGSAESLTSAATAAVINVNDSVAGQPVIVGVATEDETLTIDASGISDEDGLGSFSYQWYRDGVAVSGATADSYLLDDADVGAAITVALAYTDGGGTAETTTSNAVGPIANVNDTPTGSVLIDNLGPAQGDTLTASNTIADADGISGVIGYQWYRDGVAIGSATGSTYETTQVDVDTVITVVASYTDDEGTAESVTSSATAAVTNVNDAVSGQPVILGTPTEDQTLTIDASGISDADGLGSYSYQWYRDGVVVSGATADSYTLDDTDVGTAISVVLSYVDGEGTAETTTSNAVGPIANVNDAPTGAVSIDNLNPGEGDTLTVANTLADADGMSGAVSYQWYRDGLAIGSATGATYTTEQADVGSAMTVVASYTDDRGASESVTSAATAAVVNVNDAVVGQPLILGAATEDQTLTIDESGISDEDGLGPFSYQWYRDGVAIAGATADSLTLGDADVDANITVTLRYTDSEGTSETTTSNAVGPVANVNDNPTGTVTIDNVNPSEGDTVTATNTLADADGLSGPINYQWYRDGVAIGSATNASYTTQQADVGAALTVLASYIDDQGATESVVSSATAAVLNVNDPVSGSPVLLGMTTEDQTLTADTAGISDEDGLGAFSYQWYRDGVAVAGATSGTFALDNADVGTSIAVTVAYTDAYGAFETTSSAPSALIQNVNDAPTGSVVIDNLIPAQGDVLTATDTITDADGLSSAIGYQWLRDGVAIAGATGTTYATGQDDVGAAITVVASYTDDQGATESVLSSATGNVTNVNDLVAGQPLIVGAATENQTLGIDTSGISDPDGLGSFDYQWYRDGVAITGADADSYTLEDSDVGASISVTVSYIDGYGTAENVASDLAGPVVNVNDLPLVDGGQFFNVAESSAPGSSVGPIMGSDIDPGAMLSEWAIESGNDSDLFTIDADSGELKLSDNATLDFESAATHVLSISVSDGSARSAPVAVTVNIVDVNEAPITLADAFGGREDVAVTINVAADLLANDGDPENAVLSVASIGQPGNGVLMDNLDGTWTYLPNENFFGTDSFSYVVTDGINSTNSTATVTVDAVNDAPVLAVPSWWQMQEDLSGVATIRGSDVDGDPLSYQLGGADADAFQLDASTGVLSFVDAPDYEAPTDANADNLYEVEVAVQDSSGARTTQALQIEVENVNEAPQLAPAQFAFTPTSETLMVGAVDAADPDDGDVLNYRIVAGNDGAMFAIDQSSGQLQASDLGVPLGIYELEVEVADSEGLVSKALVQIIVTESTVTQVPLADDGLTPAEVDSGESSGRSADSAGVPQQDESGSSEPEVAAAEQEQRAEEGRAVAAFSSGPIAPVAALLTEVFAPQALALDLNALGIASNDDSAPLSGAAAGQVDLGLYIRVVFGDAVGGFDNGLDLSTEEYDGVLGLPISPELVNALDEAARAALTDGEELDLRVSGAVLGSVSLSAGFVVWILRAGSLMASLASAKPMWSHFDPLPVFANDDDSEDEHSIKL